MAATPTPLQLNSACWAVLLPSTTVHDTSDDDGSKVAKAALASRVPVALRETSTVAVAVSEHT